MICFILDTGPQKDKLETAKVSLFNSKECGQLAHDAEEQRKVRGETTGTDSERS